MKYVRVKDITKIGRGASPRPINNPLFFDDGGDFSWVRISDVTNSNKYLLKTESKLSSLGAKYSVKLTQETLFLSIAGSVGKPCINKINACIHDGFIYLKKPKYDINYLYWFFSNNVLYEGKGKVGTQLNLNSETVAELLVPHISLYEQKNIANYLDEETAKIDKKVALLEKKVELLDEYKQSLIYETVTRGLDSNVEMKDSGIDWIGMIPKHWNIKRIKDISIVATGQTPPRENIECFSEEKENNYLWVKPEDLFGNIETFQTKEYITLKGLEYIKKYKKDSIIFSGIGDIGKIGLSSVDFTTNQQNHVIYKHKQNYKYIFYFLVSAKKDVEQQSTGNVVSIFNASKLKNYLTLVPPISQQTAIANYLDHHTRKIDKQISLLEQKIELLKEYKQSLIYEAVTGKLNYIKKENIL